MSKKALNNKESVWDYPRPPEIEQFKGNIRIIFNGEIIVDTNTSYRILETSHPPTYYLPIKGFKPGILVPNFKSSFCEFKGRAVYYNIELNNRVVKQAAWHYPDAKGLYTPIKDHISVYAQFMDACYVNDEKVKAQEGEFYGGWITSNIEGPFKGGKGTMGW